MNARYQELSSYYIDQANAIRQALGTVSSVRVDSTLPEPLVTIIGVREEISQPIIQVDFTAGEFREYNIVGDRPILLSSKRPQSLLEWKEMVDGALSFHFGYMKD